jgi:hypothetical protein
MSPRFCPEEVLGSETSRFYVDVLATMRKSGVPVLVGGAYALCYYTGIAPHTKDRDLFVRPTDADRALAALAAAGYRTEETFRHWLGKAFSGKDFVDVIHSSGNGACPVDNGWFEHAVDGRVLGTPVRWCPAEEMIWQKAYIMERERFDGADVIHLIGTRGRTLDWNRLVGRFGPDWRVLLSHLVVFGFVYPGELSAVPRDVLDLLTGRLAADRDGTPPGECRGPLLSRQQYLIDTERWGYRDARLRPEGTLSREDITHWTAAAFERK